MPVVTFRMVPRGDVCLRCERPMKGHGARCSRDVVVGEDQHADTRRARLQRLQVGRGLKVKTLTEFMPEQM